MSNVSINDIPGSVTVFGTNGSMSEYCAALNESTGEIIYTGTAPEPSGVISARFEAAESGESVFEGDEIEVCPDCLGYILKSVMTPSEASDTSLEERKVCSECGE